MNKIFKERLAKLSEFQERFRNRKSSFNQKEIPDNVFKSCDKCKETIPLFTLKENLYVCPKCNYHFKITAYERIKQLVDTGSFKEMDKYVVSKNMDAFEGYSEKLKAYQSATGLHEAVIYGSAQINKQKLMLCVMDSHFMMGSMGQVVGEKITRAIELATKRRCPILISCASGGARMQEGIMSLMQMSKTSAALKRHSDAGLLYISLLTNPTTGGVSASFAMLGDIILAEPEAVIAFAGKRVIEKTINEVLPDTFQKSEFVLEKGFVDKIVSRKNLRKTIGKLLKIHKVT